MPLGDVVSVVVSLPVSMNLVRGAGGRGVDLDISIVRKPVDMGQG